MSGRSQARKSQRELQNVFTAGRGGADQRLPAAPRSIALPAPPPAAAALRTAARLADTAARPAAVGASSSEASHIDAQDGGNRPPLLWEVERLSN